MARFIVLKQVDAWVNYQAIVVADSAAEAAEMAAEHEEAYSWEGVGTNEYDHRKFYTLSEDGFPIESTERRIG